MLKFLWKVLPDKYKWSVAFRKAGAATAKFITGALVGSIAGEKLSPQHIEAVGTVVATLTVAGLEFVHDWAKMKWPEKDWLQ